MELKERQEGFNEGIKDLKEKFELDLAAKIGYNENGIFPAVVLVDVKPKEEDKPVEEVEAEVIAG